MSVHFISGKPGGGKSLYGMRLLLDELVHGSRPIVTNLAVKIPELNLYLQQVYPHAYNRRFTTTGRTIFDDVFLLIEDDLPKFFTLRAGGVRLVSSVTNDEWRSGKRPDYSIVQDSGVFYILDEVHIAFNARAWATTGHEVLYYLSQHRKLGDDVVCITQHVGNVDKQFRSVAQNYTYIRNLAKQKVGFFGLPSLFMRSTFSQPATDHAVPQESGSFTLDVSGLASCYDTAKGVGIHGRSGADTRARRRGLPWLLGFMLLAVALWVLFSLVPKIFVHVFRPRNLNHPSYSAPLKPAIVSAMHAPLLNPAPVQQMQLAKTPAPETFDRVGDVYCVGYHLRGGQATVILSDGRIAVSEDGEVQKILKRRVKAFGEWYEVRQNQNAYVSTEGAAQTHSATSEPAQQQLTVDTPPRPIILGQNGRDWSRRNAEPPK